MENFAVIAQGRTLLSITPTSYYRLTTNMQIFNNMSADQQEAGKKSDVYQVAFHHALNYLNGLEKNDVAATVDLSELRRRFCEPLPVDGTSAVQVINRLVSNVEGGLLGCSGGRFFAWVTGGGIPSALAADWLTSSWDQNSALFVCGPAASVVEEVTGEWLRTLFGLPTEASFALTTGCQMAHFTCLAAARYAVLKAHDWDVNADGLFGAPRVRIIVSDQRHASVDRAVRYLGFGNRSIVSAPTDADGMVDVSSFETLLCSDTAPTIVVLDAADLNIAAIDPFVTLIPLAKKYNAWVHIDGAFGMFVTASSQKRHLVKGIELADSWATDGHKWLNIPYDCGFAFIRNREAHKVSMTITASYIASSSANIELGANGEVLQPARDQIDWNPEWSRRARGFPVYAALRELGSSGVEDLVNRSCQHCANIVSGIGALPGAEVLWAPTLNQGLVRFLDPAHADAITHDAHKKRTADVLAAVNASGKAFFSGVTWRGHYAMRVSVVNWRTTQQDVDITVEAVKHALAAF